MKTNSDTTPAIYIGLDVHKEKTSVAIADPGPQGEIRLHGEVATTHVKEHAPPLAGAHVETGVEVHTTGDVEDRTAMFR